MAGVRPIAVENLKQTGRVLRCIYIKTDGVQCGSPGLRNCAYCYAHSRLAMRHPSRLDIPILEDANSVQVAIMEVIRGLLAGDVDRKTGGLILYGLQMAASNLKYVCFEPKDRASVIRNVDHVVRYCQVDMDVRTDQAGSDAARAGQGPREESRTAINGHESDAPAEVRVSAENSQPPTGAACDLEPAADGVASAGDSSAGSSEVDQFSREHDGEDLDSPGMREKLGKLRAEARAMSGEEPLPSAEAVQEAGLNSTSEMLDAVAETHRLARAVVDAERRIGESVW
jgi:hypothetical protein